MEHEGIASHSGARAALPALRTAARIAAVILALFLSLPPGIAADGDQVERNKAATRAAVEALFVRRDFASFEAAHTRDFVKHYNNRPAENLAQEMADAKGQFEPFPDLAVTINWMVAEGDKVAYCFSASGTFKAPLRGIPPTGKRFEGNALTVWRFVGGKIAEEWVFADEMELYRQLGLLK